VTHPETVVVEVAVEAGVGVGVGVGVAAAAAVQAEDVIVVLGGERLPKVEAAEVVVEAGVEAHHHTNEVLAIVFLISFVFHSFSDQNLAQHHNIGVICL